MREARSAADVPARAERVSRALLGSRYVDHPLAGAPGRPEELTASLAGFDCVTYVETVLAAALVRDEADFFRTLRRLRYQDGTVTWLKRNHYMSGWIRANRRTGLVRAVALGPGEVVRKRLLDVVAGLPPREAILKVLPKRLVRGAARRLRTGDLICFASERGNLDVFHCGVLVKDEDRVLLRHASRSRGAVVEQDLFEFLSKNRMAGVIVARPVERRRA